MKKKSNDTGINRKKKVSQEIRRIVFERDGGMCWKCKRELRMNGSKKKLPRAHFHHLVHRAQGGTDAPENLVLTCWECECVTHGRVNGGKNKME
jgi:5-methylcytosine-specific restriction endonuclease McrA